MEHIPVLLQEVVEGLNPKEGEVILDATVGGGGHSEALCRKAGGKATIVCLDEDEDALEKSRQRLEGCGCGCGFLFSRINFRELDRALDSFGIWKVNRVFFDLGMSSFQLEEGGRGFSFLRDEPLLMTFRKSPAKDALTAERIVNDWDEKNIEIILRGYGEERDAKQIVRAILKARAKKSIKTSRELAELIESVVRRRGKIHPATRTFQALRIATNDEFHALSEALSKVWDRLATLGRIAVISFNSIEDRVVKRFFAGLIRSGKGRRITKKPKTATREEVSKNPRARSAKLRIIEKI